MYQLLILSLLSVSIFISQAYAFCNPSVVSSLNVAITSHHHHRHRSNNALGRFSSSRHHITIKNCLSSSSKSLTSSSMSNHNLPSYSSSASPSSLLLSLSSSDNNNDNDNQQPNNNVVVGYNALLNRPYLALSDALTLTIFAAIGKASHATDGSIDLTAVLTTALPFLLSWLSLSPLVGCYDYNATSGKSSIGDVISTAGKGWAISIPMGCALRGVMKGYVPPVSFVIVTLVVTLVMMSGSRVIFSFVEDKFKTISEEAAESS